MAHIQWDEQLNTGIQVIDSQHRRIVEYINSLYDASLTHNRTDVEQVLQNLVDYTLSHFAFEESLMEEAGYPFINGHKRVHELFVKRINNFQQRFKIGDDITDELLAALKSWLINHIKSDDNDYTDTVLTNMNYVNTQQNSGWLSRSLKHFFS